MSTYPLMPNLGRVSSVTGEDSSKHSVEMEDPAIRVESENGYVFTRPKHTRGARQTISSGFTAIDEGQRQILLDFYRKQHGGVLPFYYKNPVSGDLQLVRFADKLTFTYKGIGGVHLWDVVFKLSEV